MRDSRADEPQVIYVVRLICEIVWIHLKFYFEVLRAMYRTILPQEPKDVRDEVIVVSLFVFIYF